MFAHLAKSQQQRLWTECIRLASYCERDNWRSLKKAIRLGVIVEGDGELSAIPHLFRRMRKTYLPEVLTSVDDIVPLPSGSIRKADELVRALELQSRRIGRSARFFVLFDGDQKHADGSYDCPATIGPALLAAVGTAHSDLALSVVLAKYEYEAWFLAAQDSLVECGLLTERAIEDPADCEQFRGAKELIRMADGRRYKPTLNQAELTQSFDLHAAFAHSRSFRKIVSDYLLLAQM